MRPSCDKILQMPALLRHTKDAPLYEYEGKNILKKYILIVIIIK